MAPLSWRPRHVGVHKSGGRSQARRKQAAGSDGNRSRLRVGGWVPDPQRERPTPDEDLFRSVDLSTNATQSYDSAEYDHDHLHEHPSSGAPPGWSPPAPEWTEPPEWDDTPTTTWTRPAKWTEPAERWDGDGGKRARWPNAQMLFRRRYNTAAVVTITGVGAVLVLLATLATGVRNSAGNAVPGASGGTGQNQTAQYEITTFEAESPANTLIGSANVTTYSGASGGKLVRAIGDWGSPKGSGALRFNNVMVPKNGFYVMTFYFVNIKANVTRTTIITASGSPSKSVTVASDSACCTPQQLLIFLFKGRNSITFSNPNAEAPAIDKITIAVPMH
ncbi:MAG TPA: hypothetical protein VJT31_24365 [Rugosimonospora sp.]|nr:hypothetical protein [Rugosimonospora sp.]